MHAKLAILLVVPLLASCGAMMVPGPFLVPVDSEPSGAVVVYAGKEVGVTPCLVAMQRHSSELELRRDSCHARIVEVGTEPNRWVAGNVATFGLGMFVDMALGAHVNPVDDPVLVGLASTDEPPLPTWMRVTELTGSQSAPQDRRQVPRVIRARAAGPTVDVGGLFAGLLEALFRRH